MEQVDLVENVAFNLINQAVIYLPEDVKKALKRAYDEETSKIGKRQLKIILDNIALAEKEKVPLCQDTGIAKFYIRTGAQVKKLDEIEREILRATQRATRDIPLRPNAVNPFTQKNSGDNTGRFTPSFDWEIVPGNNLELTVMIKGGGSENFSAIGMLSPSQGILGIKKFVIDTVVKAGAQPCPPSILGVAIGGGTEIATKLAKKALLRPLDKPNSDPSIAKLEKEIFEVTNMTGIGPMGMGGKTTILGVHIDYAHRHPATFPVAVAINCWAARRATAKIGTEGKVEYLNHNLF